ncbi:MAG: NUDIX hydrolase [Actinomycetes bacterium]
MKDQAYRLLLQVYRRLPRPVRRWAVRAGTPKYTVGAICIVRRDDGQVLLARHSYWSRWGTPGGLAKRGEHPEVAAVRETREEVNLDIEVLGEPTVVVEPRPHRVDCVFLARPVPGAALSQVRPSSPEIVKVGWFPLDDLPELQVETATALAALERAGRLTPSSGRPTR